MIMETLQQISCGISTKSEILSDAAAPQVKAGVIMVPAVPRITGIACGCQSQPPPFGKDKEIIPNGGAVPSSPHVLVRALAADGGYPTLAG
jgi:hypothetical protein